MVKNKCFPLPQESTVKVYVQVEDSPYSKISETLQLSSTYLQLKIFQDSPFNFLFKFDEWIASIFLLFVFWICLNLCLPYFLQMHTTDSFAQMWWNKWIMPRIRRCFSENCNFFNSFRLHGPYAYSWYISLQTSKGKGEFYFNTSIQYSHLQFQKHMFYHENKFSMWLCVISFKNSRLDKNFSWRSSKIFLISVDSWINSFFLSQTLLYILLNSYFQFNPLIFHEMNNFFWWAQSEYQF